MLPRARSHAQLHCHAHLGAGLAAFRGDRRDRGTPAGCRLLARRARQKIERRQLRGTAEHGDGFDKQVTDAFIACANGDLAVLVGTLDPGASGTIDIREGVVVSGRENVARNLLRFWCSPDTVMVSQAVCGHPALLGFIAHELAGILLLTVENGRIIKIHVVAEAAKLEFARSQLSSAVHL